MSVIGHKNKLLKNSNLHNFLQFVLFKKKRINKQTLYTACSDPTSDRQRDKLVNIVEQLEAKSQILPSGPKTVLKDSECWIYTHQVIRNTTQTNT